MCNYKQSSKCQIHNLQLMSEKNTKFEVIQQLLRRIRHMFLKRVRFFFNWLLKTKKSDAKKKIKTEKNSEVLKPGITVRVKSKKEIKATLNKWNELKGCMFMEEMSKYCGTEQRVLKHVKRFLDERDYRVKKCKGIVLLENIICQGTIDFGPCDRSCFFFWREEWLEKID